MSEGRAPDLTSFSAMMAGLRADGDAYWITLPEDWLQGRTAYGGLSAALCLAATLRAAPALAPLRSAQFAFIAPATGTLRIVPSVLRQGKSASFVGVELFGDSGLAARATLCFGAERALADAYGGLAFPAPARADDCPAFYRFANQPNFMNHFDGRLAGGGAPLSASARPEMLVWLRHRDTNEPDDLVRLIALADALPPAAFVSFKDSAIISTMAWSIEMLDAKPSSPDGWWLVRGAADTVARGYSTQSTVIWSPDTRPVLYARQTIAIFEKR
ncbi:MAG: thioesterase family protein [Quisquiliibacterium sp.]